MGDLPKNVSDRPLCSITKETKRLRAQGNARRRTVSAAYLFDIVVAAFEALVVDGMVKA